MIRPVFKSKLLEIVVAGCPSNIYIIAKATVSKNLRTYIRQDKITDDHI